MTRSRHLSNVAVVGGLLGIVGVAAIIGSRAPADATRWIALGFATAFGIAGLVIGSYRSPRLGWVLWGVGCAAALAALISMNVISAYYHSTIAALGVMVLMAAVFLIKGHLGKNRNGV